MEIVLLGIVIGCTSWLIANWGKVSQVLEDEELPALDFLRNVMRPAEGSSTRQNGTRVSGASALSPAEEPALDGAGEANVNVETHTAVIPAESADLNLPTLAAARAQPHETNTVRTDDEPHFENSTEPDDLQVLWGVGPAVERALHAVDVFTYARLASLTDEEIDLFVEQQSILSRIRREDLVEQAQELLEELEQAS